LQKRQFANTAAYPSLKAEAKPAGELKKELRLFGVYAIATGTTLSAGFFLLPSFAAQQAGSAIVLAYMLAGLLLVPAMFSAVELATAMPRSGGAYYFLDRSLGPWAGTIGGTGTWLALILKTAFALVGMGAYVAVLVPGDTPPWFYTAVAAGLALFFGVVNLLGAKKTGGFQILLVIGLLTLLTAFIGTGLPQVDVAKFDAMFDVPRNDVFATAGLVFISYVGVTKVASVAEEVRDPERNLPRGVFLALGTAMAIYVLGLIVMVGVVGADRLAADPFRGGRPDLTPVATTASILGGDYGRIGAIIVSVAALLAFSSVANAGILSASRYPLAMSRDRLLPRAFEKVGSTGAPTLGVLLTVSCIVALVFVDPMKIAKLASGFQLLMFGLLSLAVIVMRESKIEAYDPGFRSPFYPWLHITGVIGPAFFIYQMGWLPTLFTLGLVLLGTVWYLKYASKRVARQGAIYHVFERLGRRRFDGLDTELRGILKEKGLRQDDPFDEVVALAQVIDAPAGETYESIVQSTCERLAEGLPKTADELRERFMDGTRIGATPVTSGVALPHLRLAEIKLAKLVIVRSVESVSIEVADAFGEGKEQLRVAALFFLISPEDDPALHLRMLAQLAGAVDQPAFMDKWLAARDAHRLKEIILRDEHHLSVRLPGDSPWVGNKLMELDMPEGCLVVMIHRDGQLLVPRGATELEAMDRLTIIGDPPGIKSLRETLDM
jgi:amino acid transporter/mannitol/fructose-specific phosphotransferase system IIA component (Ntr-type)